MVLIDLQVKFLRNGPSSHGTATTTLVELFEKYQSGIGFSLPVAEKKIGRVLGKEEYAFSRDTLVFVLSMLSCEFGCRIIDAGEVIPVQERDSAQKSRAQAAQPLMKYLLQFQWPIRPVPIKFSSTSANETGITDALESERRCRQFELRRDLLTLHGFQNLLTDITPGNKRRANPSCGNGNDNHSPAMGPQKSYAEGQ